MGIQLMVSVSLVMSLSYAALIVLGVSLIID